MRQYLCTLNQSVGSQCESDYGRHAIHCLSIGLSASFLAASEAYKEWHLTFLNDASSCMWCQQVYDIIGLSSAKVSQSANESVSRTIRRGVGNPITQSRCQENAEDTNRLHPLSSILSSDNPSLQENGLFPRSRVPWIGSNRTERLLEQNDYPDRFQNNR
jgi:hypothetical protein